MIDYWKAAAIVILTVVLGTAIGKTEKDIVVVLSVAACCMVACIAMQYWAEAINFIWKLNNTVLRGSMFLETLLRIVGVSLLTELTCLISADAGNTSLGKAMQILGNAVNLVLSLPVFENFFTTIQEILRIT